MNTLIASAGLSSPAGGAGAGRSSPDPARVLGADVLALQVLVIEDEAMIAWTLETMLEDFGFLQIEIAAAHSEAMEKARRRTPGLIISDINLGQGQVDGLTTSISIAAEHATPVVFVSGYAGPEDRRRMGRELPGAILLRKPVTGAELLDAIQAATRRDQC